MRLKNGLIVLTLLLSASSCIKNQDNYANIPYVAVSEYLYLNNPSYSNLNAIGGSVYVNGGNKGIIVTKTSIDQFSAYERTCTYSSGESCAKVKIDSINPNSFHCACCTSIFGAFAGEVQNGPALLPLLQYATSYNASLNVLTISN